MLIKIYFLLLASAFVAGSDHWEEKHHSPKPYHFGYEVKDKEGKQYRHEESDGSGTVRGSYGYTDDKGIYREVHYIADKSGFRAHVKTNEPGTANQDPADVKVEANPQYHHVRDTHHKKYSPDVHIPVVHKIHVPVKQYHHVPIKQYHHVPVKHYHHVQTKSYNTNNYSPIHGFSYKPSSFHKHSPHWNLDNNYNFNKDSDLGGYKFHIPHYRKVHGLKDNDGYDSYDGYGYLQGVDGMDSKEIDRLIEDIKKKIQQSEGYKGFSDSDFGYQEYRDIGNHKYKSSFGKDYFNDGFDR